MTHNTINNTQLMAADARGSFDPFRVEGSKIDEHWDTAAEFPSQVAQNNGKF
ncbi:hypothetical protein [Cognatishimia maritima]|uniref:hypothetical protein n=1 Tax=Cognatishimia maritima TaxID=870908 RepID=UPI0013F4C47D|nr:hypothetical protein [Cognatishimia maritima]